VLCTWPRGDRSANRLLAAFIAGYALLSISDGMRTLEVMLAAPRFAHVFDWLVFALGPLAYGYVLTVTGRGVLTGRWALRHFAFAGLMLALIVADMFRPLATLKLELEAELRQGAYELNPLMVVAAGQTFAYLLACLWQLRRYVVGLELRHSALEQRNLRWLRWLLAVNALLWVVWVAAIGSDSAAILAVDAIGFPLSIYLLGYLALRQPRLFLDPPTAESPAGTRYARSSLTSSRAEELLQRLEGLMAEEKPWLENDLTLSQLAERLGVTPHHLSQVLNERVGKTFFDFINEQRINEVQRCLADSAYRQQSVLDIALASGFNSKAAFNATFKRYTGMTPSEYRRRAALSASDTSARPGRTSGSIGMSEAT
jgi:AraC-like DNA-binding protein